MTWWHEYIGAPFRDGARGPDEYDCWGLVVAVYRHHLDIALPDYGEISAADMIAVARAMNAGRDVDPWRAVTDPLPFDVATMRHPSSARVGHVGVMVDARHVLHIEAATAAAVVPVSHWSVCNRLAGYRRYDRA